MDDRTCETCKYESNPMTSAPCRNCDTETGSSWERVDEDEYMREGYEPKEENE